MAAQLIGYAALLLYISMFWQKSRRLLLLFGMAESILYGIHYCLLDGLTGGIVDILCAGMMGIYLLKEKGRPWDSPLVPGCFLAAFTAVLALTWHGPDSLVVYAAVALAAVTDWQDDARIVRLGAFVAQVLWLTYSVLLGSVPGMIGDTMVLVSAFAAILRMDVKKRV